MKIIDLDSPAAVDELLRRDRAWLMKHSNSCSISSAAEAEVGRYLDERPDEVLGQVVVQTHRPISNLIAQKLHAVHQTPQIFLLISGKPVWQASHWSITADALAAAAARFPAAN